MSLAWAAGLGAMVVLASAAGATFAAEAGAAEGIRGRSGRHELADASDEGLGVAEEVSRRGFGDMKAPFVIRAESEPEGGFEVAPVRRLHAVFVDDEFAK